MTKEIESPRITDPTHPDAETAFRVWIGLNRAHRLASDRIEGALRDAGLPPLVWYDVLLELSRAGDGLRANVLEQRMLLAQYNLSRLIDRLEKAALVRRSVDPEDHRGRIVHITGKGRDLREAMWPVYASAVRSVIAEHFETKDPARLADLLAKPRADAT